MQRTKASLKKVTIVTELQWNWTMAPYGALQGAVLPSEWQHWEQWGEMISLCHIGHILCNMWTVETCGEGSGLWCCNQTHWRVCIHSFSTVTHLPQSNPLLYPPTHFMSRSTPSTNLLWFCSRSMVVNWCCQSLHFWLLLINNKVLKKLAQIYYSQIWDLIREAVQPTWVATHQMTKRSCLATSASFHYLVTISPAFRS